MLLWHRVFRFPSLADFLLDGRYSIEVAIDSSILKEQMPTKANPVYVFDLTAVSPLSTATLDLLNMPVKRKDTGETVALGKFLAGVTASQLYTANGIPAVAVLSWGKGLDGSVFSQVLKALGSIGLHGGEWKAEGWGGRSLNYVSAYAEAESTESTYMEISPVANREPVQGVMNAWAEHIVNRVGKDDPLSFMIVATAKTSELAEKIKNAARDRLIAVCFPE